MPGMQFEPRSEPARHWKSMGRQTCFMTETSCPSDEPNPPPAGRSAAQSEVTLHQYLQKYLQYLSGSDRRKIIVLLSGGVDSSVALAGLKRYGWQNLAACYLKIWFQDDAQFLGDCPWEEDLEYAADVCEQLDVPLHVVPMQQQYYRHVVEYTLSELRCGRSPSPDLLCNQFVKFGAFWQYLQERYDGVAAPLIASGHYARLEVLPVGGGIKTAAETEPNEILLHQAPDPIKDQSYFLSRLSQIQLRRLLFPLGCLQKYEVRQLAEAWGLASARRKDSQGICFLGKVKFRDFARHYLGRKPGPILDIDNPEGLGQTLGQHEGLWFHTIGQRQGLGLSGGPWYVCAKDMQQNILYVRHSSRTAAVQADSTTVLRLPDRFRVGTISWLQGPEAGHRLRIARPDETLRVKLRHGPTQIPCRLTRLPAPVQDPQDAQDPQDEAWSEIGGEIPDESRERPQAERQETEQWLVEMAQGDRGVAPGQFAVFYWGDVCLGSAGILGLEFPESPPANDGAQ